MGDFEVEGYDEKDELTADVIVTDEPATSLYVPSVWTDANVAYFESAIAQLPAEKRGVTMLKTRFGNFKRHYELLNRDTASLQKTIQYLEGKRSSGPKRDVTKSLRKTAQAFFTGMSEAILYKQAKVFGLNAAMYDTNEALIEALVQQHIAAHTE